MRYALAALLLTACTRPPGGMGETGDPLEDCRAGARATFDACTVKCEGTPCKAGICTQNCGGFYMDEAMECEDDTACLEAAQAFLSGCPVTLECQDLDACLDDWGALVDACFAE